MMMTMVSMMIFVPVLIVTLVGVSGGRLQTESRRAE